MQKTSKEGSKIFCVKSDDDGFYCHLKPLIEELGLDWVSQYVKLRKNSRWAAKVFNGHTLGGNQNLICIPLRKLPAFLNKLNAKFIADKYLSGFAQFQRHCDDALAPLVGCRLFDLGEGRSSGFDAIVAAVRNIFITIGIKDFLLVFEDAGGVRKEIEI